jgi:hypothetical protein
MIAPGLEAETMEDLFRSYWWLLFPLAWFVVGGWQSWLNYRRHRDTLDIIKTYADSGKDVPAGLRPGAQRGHRTCGPDTGPGRRPAGLHRGPVGVQPGPGAGSRRDLIGVTKISSGRPHPLARSRAST